MGTIDISLSSLILAFFLLVLPVFLAVRLKIGIVRPLFYSLFRMLIQLLFIAFFLKFLFKVNNPFINLSWLIVMIVMAVFTAVKKSDLNIKRIALPVFCSFSAATFLVVFYLNVFVIRLDNIFDARYLIVLGGMLLGNSLRGNIVGISNFYKDIKKNNRQFMYVLSLGANKFEAVLPYIRNSVEFALTPTIAAMATMGIVSLPGMMTGVILGGTDPSIAIKYQIMIMIGIVVSTIISVILTILTTMMLNFTPYGLLRADVFNNK